MSVQNVYYQVNSAYLHRTIAGEDILISLGGNIANFNGYVALNATASFLWDSLKTPKTALQLQEALLEEFTVEAAVAQADVEDFLQMLLEKDMIREVTYAP